MSIPHTDRKLSPQEWEALELDAQSWVRRFHPECVPDDPIVDPVPHPYRTPEVPK
jgi:hypothetical protein